MDINDWVLEVKGDFVQIERISLGNSQLRYSTGHVGLDSNGKVPETLVDVSAGRGTCLQIISDLCDWTLG